MGTAPHEGEGTYAVTVTYAEKEDTQEDTEELVQEDMATAVTRSTLYTAR
jgi:hypothetical protein